MNRFPTQLHFDESGSAAIRLFGTKVADVKVHWKKGTRQNFLACPKDIGIIGYSCSGCTDDVGCSTRTIALGWDLSKQRWCVLMAHPDVVKRTFEASLEETGNLSEITQQGLGPDLIMQVVNGHTFVRVLEGTAGIPRGNGRPPKLEDFLHGMESRSVWRGPKDV